MLKHDPIEDKEEYREIFQNVNKAVAEVLEKKNIKRNLGYIHIFDRDKKAVLLRQYGIDWKTTQEMNPGIRID